MGIWNNFTRYFTSNSQVSEAIEFYRIHILKGNSLLAPMCEKYGFKSHIPGWKWEMFAAILVNDVAKNGNGCDLLKHEVKSAKSENSFEYQYHRNSWKEKLAHEHEIDHVFVSYEPGYRDISVRVAKGSDLAAIFDKWLPCVEKTYDGSGKKQRCRKSISFSTIEEKGLTILEIENGKLKSYAPSYYE